MSSTEEKEKKRRKQLKRMAKVLAKAWELNEPVFQEDPKSTPDYVLSLTTVGEKIDAEHYRLGRHGWEEFAQDLGGVYNRHIQRYVQNEHVQKSNSGQIEC